MTEADESGLLVPEQVIFAPKSVSPQAQAYLAATAKRIAASAGADGKNLDDRNPVEQGAQDAIAFLRPLAESFEGSVETIDLPCGAQLYCVTPQMAGSREHHAYLDIHGGGFITGGGEMCQLLARIRAMEYGVQTFAVDYRLAPVHPYPAALDDCVAAYREVLKRHRPSSVIVGGASAGGNLAAALMLRAREEGLALPLALLLQTPAVDLSQSGDSYATNRFLDVNLQGGAGSGPPSYLGDNDSRHPFVSPLFGDFSGGWPPTILTTGTRDLLLSDTVRMHRALRRAGVRAELHVAEAAPHGGFMGAGASEDREIMVECRQFMESAWAA